MSDIHYGQPGPDHVEEMFRLRREVFVERGYLPATVGRLDIDEWDGHSHHFVAMRDGNLVGTVRLVLESPLGLPIELGFRFAKPFDGADGGRVVEVSRLVVAPGLDLKHRVMLGLLRETFRFCWNHGLTCWYLAADEGVYRILVELGFPLTRLGPPEDYMGSRTVPAYVDLRSGIHLLRKASPRIADYFQRDDQADCHCSRSGVGVEGL